ncbi:MAG TPA: ABC transporter permease [Longimicrobium sp.]
MVPSARRRWSASRRRSPGAFVTLVGGIALAFLVVPILVVALISFSDSRYLLFPPRDFSLRWYRAAFADESWRAAFVASCQIAAAVTILATSIGTLGAFALVRGRMRWKSALMAVALSPIVIPGIVLAVGSYFLFAQVGLLETRVALIAAHTALALPVVLVSVVTSLQTVDPTLEQAARTLGASPREVALRVTLPLIRPGILAGAVFAFVISFDEPVVALFVAGTHLVTLPKRMWDGIQYEIDPTSAAVSVLLVCVSFAVAVAAQLSAARRASSAAATAAPSPQDP